MLLILLMLLITFIYYIYSLLKLNIQWTTLETKTFVTKKRLSRSQALVPSYSFIVYTKKCHFKPKNKDILRPRVRMCRNKQAAKLTKPSACATFTLLLTGRTAYTHSSLTPTQPSLPLPPSPPTTSSLSPRVCRLAYSVFVYVAPDSCSLFVSLFSFI